MNSIINTSNNELETLKNVGPFRIQCTDNSNYQTIEFKETIISKPIIIEIKEVESKKILEKSEEYGFGEQGEKIKNKI